MNTQKGIDSRLDIVEERLVKLKTTMEVIQNEICRKNILEK